MGYASSDIIEEPETNGEVVFVRRKSIPFVGVNVPSTSLHSCIMDHDSRQILHLYNGCLKVIPFDDHVAEYETHLGKCPF
ncbi:hypothetical protein V6N13_031822 [Hibiscus sabdariffa]